MALGSSSKQHAAEKRKFSNDGKTSSKTSSTTSTTSSSNSNSGLTDGDPANNNSLANGQNNRPINNNNNRSSNLSSSSIDNDRQSSSSSSFLKISIKCLFKFSKSNGAALLVTLCCVTLLTAILSVIYVRQSLKELQLSPHTAGKHGVPLHPQPSSDSMPTQKSETSADKKKHQASVEHANVNILNLVDNKAGMLMRPDGAQILANDIDAWLERMPAQNILYMSVDDHKYEPIVDTTWVSKYGLKTWPMYMISYYNSTPEERAAYMERMMEVRILGPDYPAPPLRGQRGVFAKIDIPKDELLGIYVGIVIKDGIEESQSFDMRAELDWLKALDTNIRPGDIGRYAFEVPLSSKSDYEGDTLIVSALNRGNLLCLVNSYWAPPQEQNDTDPRYNVGTAALRINAHVPVIAFYATRPIKAGEELMTDYGKTYWDDTDDMDESNIAQVGLFTNRFLTDVDSLKEPWYQILPDANSEQTGLQLITELQMLGLKDFCVNEQKIETSAHALTNATKCPSNKNWMFPAKAQLERHKCCGIAW